MERTAMSSRHSRRVRKHAMGLRVNASHDASGERGDVPSPSSPSERSVTLIKSGVLVKVPTASRPEPMLETSSGQDRQTLNQVHDKLFTLQKRETYISMLFRSFDTERRGSLPYDKFRAALDRLNMGLSEDDKGRLIKRFDPAGSGQVSYNDFMRGIELNHPLGGPLPQRRQFLHMVRAPYKEGPAGDEALLKGSDSSTWRAWNRAQAPPAIPGIRTDVAEGSYEQRAADAYLLSLLATKLGQRKDKLLVTFRTADANKNSRVDRQEFLKAIGKMRLGLGLPQVNRLFDICDTDGDGEIDYEEFYSAFDGTRDFTVARPSRVHDLAALAERLGLSHPGEAEVAMAEPPVATLKHALYLRGASAQALFSKYDLNRDGLLSVEELTRCCQELSPAMSARHVAAIVVHSESHQDGYMDYRQFVRRLIDGDPSGDHHGASHYATINPHRPAAQQQPRQAPSSAPSGSAAGAMEAVTAALRNHWGDSPLHEPVSPGALAAAGAGLVLARSLSARQQESQRPWDAAEGPAASAFAGAAAGDDGGSPDDAPPLGAATSPRAAGGAGAGAAPLSRTGSASGGRALRASASGGSLRASLGAYQGGGMHSLLAGGGLASSASGGLGLNPAGLERSCRQDTHDLAVAPFLESLARCSTAPVGALRASMPDMRSAASAASASALLTAGGPPPEERGGGQAPASPSAAAPAQRASTAAWSTSRSVDWGQLPSAAGGGGGSGFGYASHVIDSAAESSQRLARLKHPDTRHITAVAPDCALAAPGGADYTFARKGSPGFYDFQLDDKARKGRAASQAKARFDISSALEAAHSARDASVAPETAARLATLQAAKQQYAERAQLYDAARSYCDAPASSLFGRIQVFDEHKLPISNSPLRTFW